MGSVQMQNPVTRFKPQAKLDVTAEGHILRLEAMGPFNKALVIYLFLIGRDLLAETVAKGVPYAVVIKFHGSLMMSPDSIKQLVELLDDSERRGGGPPLATAYVVQPDVEGLAVMLPILADIYRKTRAFEAFSSQTDAEDWIRSVLRQASTAS